MECEVRVGAGSLAEQVSPTYAVPHVWTEDGVAVEGGGTGAHLLLVAVATSVLDEVFREADASGVSVRGVLVEAAADFASSWSSADLGYSVRVDTDAEPTVVDQLLARVDDVAEIPRAVRGEVRVGRR